MCNTHLRQTENPVKYWQVLNMPLLMLSFAGIFFVRYGHILTWLQSNFAVYEFFLKNVSLEDKYL